MKKYNNKILIAVLVVLLGGVALVRFLRAPERDGNLRKKLIDFDSTKITKIEIIRPRRGDSMALILQEEGWKITEGDKEAKVDSNAISTMLFVAGNIGIRNLVARKKEQWTNFEVTDSSAINVRLYNGTDNVADVRIGRVGFGQAKQGDMFSYVRRADEDDVYATREFLNFHFDKGFDSWRDDGLIRLNKGDVQKVVFNYPDSGFVLEKKDSLWYIGSQTISPEKIDAYLGKLEQRDMNTFNDEFTPPTTSNPLVVRIDGESGVLATLRAWPGNEDEAWTINSSFQDDIYFTDPQGAATNDIFVGKRIFDD